MTKKTPNWQEHDNDIFAQFPDSPAPELMALRQEPDWALRIQILSIPQEEQETRKRFQWLFDGRLVNRLAGAAVLVVLVVVLGFWISSISTINVPTTAQPESAAPVSTLRPTGTPTRDFSYLSPSNIITATPTETGSCPITPFLQGDPGVGELGMGSYFINESRTIWANRPRGWQTGGEKVLWIKPAGSELKITGRLLGTEYDIPLDVAMPCCYDGGFQVTSLIFFLPGCWEVTAEAGEEQLQFVTEVTASEGTVLQGLTLLEHQLSSTTPAANEPLTVTLNWQARTTDTEEMLIFLQLIDSNGNIIVQDDEPMLPGPFKAQFITTTHSLEIPEQTGIFTLRLILAHEETFTCFAFWYNDEPVHTGVLTLGSLEITAE